MDKENVLEDNKRKDVLDCMSEKKSQTVTGGLKNLEDDIEVNKIPKCLAMVEYGFPDILDPLDIRPILDEEETSFPDK